MLNIIKKIFGSGNQREISRINKIVEKINSLENEYSELSLDQLKKKFLDLSKNENDLDVHLPDVFAITREVSKKTLKLRPFDVQLVGGIVYMKVKLQK